VDGSTPARGAERCPEARQPAAGFAAAVLPDDPDDEVEVDAVLVEELPEAAAGAEGVLGAAGVLLVAVAVDLPPEERESVR
jgi:hypothetical protein